MFKIKFKDFPQILETFLGLRREGVEKEKIDFQNYNKIDAFKDTHALYLLNDYKITPKFNFRAGLRWEHSEYGSDRKNRMILGVHNAQSSGMANRMAIAGLLNEYQMEAYVQGKLSYLDVDLSLKETHVKER